VKGCVVQKTGEPILMIYTSYDVILHKELPFGVTMIALALQFLVSFNFKILINSLRL